MAKLIEQKHGGKINQLEKGETANPNGRPRKLFSTVNAELKEKGITPLSKEQLVEAYGLVFNTDEEELQRIASDKNYPFALRLIILELSNKNNRAKAMADYRDYMFGKAKEEIKHTVDVNGGDFINKIRNGDIKNMDAYSALIALESLNN